MKKKKHVLALIMFVVFVVLGLYTAGYAHGLSIYKFQHTLERFGNWSYLFFFILCTFRSFLLLPCGFSSALGGLLFGSVKGSLVALAGYTAGSTLLFYLTRKFGKGWAMHFLHNKSAHLEKIVADSGFWGILTMRIVPVLPFDAVSCIGGISNIKVSDYILATFIGSLPGVFLYVYFGDALKTLSFRQIMLPLAIILLMSSISVIFRFKDRIWPSLKKN